MKKLTTVLIALVLVMSTAAASADGPKAIDGISPREIEIHKAGLNPSADEMIAQGISPTTGRKLNRISCPEGFSGTAVTNKYQPVMVQISNDRNGIGYTEDGKLYAVAPVNGSYADVVYEACQVMGGSETRMSMIFSDTVPDYVGFLRSTRLTHVRIRQEWDCIFCSSGYARADVPQEWSKMGVSTPFTAKDVSQLLVYLGDVGINKPWKQYVRRLKGIRDANNELFELAKIMDEIIPQDHVPANHTWKFTDELPDAGDRADIIYVTFGDQYRTNSRLEYDEDDNVYIRYVAMKKDRDMEYRESVLINPKDVDERKNGALSYRTEAEDRIPGNTITFSNVIIQGITMNWRGSIRPDPVLVGSGNADYFIGGRHIAGVWERDDYNSRTVFYGPDGEEIELQRGRTLIILMGYNNKASKVEYE